MKIRLHDRRKMAKGGLVGLVTGAVMLMGSVAASADSVSGASGPPDGYVYLRLDNSNGPLVKYAVSNNNLGAYANRVVAVDNRSYVNNVDDHINLFYNTNGPNGGSAWACIGPGTHWAQQGSGSAPITFSRGKGRDGYGTSIWKEVASIQMVSKCSG